MQLKYHSYFNNGHRYLGVIRAYPNGKYGIMVQSVEYPFADLLGELAHQYFSSFVQAKAALESFLVEHLGFSEVRGVNEMEALF